MLTAELRANLVESDATGDPTVIGTAIRAALQAGATVLQIEETFRAAGCTAYLMLHEDGRLDLMMGAAAYKARLKSLGLTPGAVRERMEVAAVTAAMIA